MEVDVPFPDGFSAAASGLFPTADEPRAEGLARLADQMAVHIQRAVEALSVLDDLGLDGIASPESSEIMEADVCMAGRRADLLSLFAAHLKDVLADDATPSCLKRAA
jgi:hypothetical protein